jgi:hypothetical protein
MPERTPAAFIAHASAGRTRVRVPGRRGDTDFFATSAARLAEFEGVLAVTPRASTSSLLVEHEGEFDAIAKRARAAGLFALGRPAEEEEALAPRLAIPGLAGVLGALAVVQLFRQRVLPPAITLLWYAASVAGRRHLPSASATSVRSQGKSRSRRPT